MSPRKQVTSVQRLGRGFGHACLNVAELIPSAPTRTSPVAEHADALVQRAERELAEHPPPYQADLFDRRHFDYLLASPRRRA